MKKEKKVAEQWFALLSFAVAVTALYCALRGVFDRQLYHAINVTGVISQRMIWGSRAQDIISALIAVGAGTLAVLTYSKPTVLKRVILLGFDWYFLYAFGLYVIQGAYTAIYGLYLLIFGMSVYAMIFGFAGFRKEEMAEVGLGHKTVKALSAFFAVIVVMLTTVWLSQMLKDIALRHPGETYAVYIMDLGIVFPAMSISIYLLLKRRALGTALAGVCLIKTITLCLSWAFGEWTQPVIGNAVSPEMAMMSTGLCLMGVLLWFFYVRSFSRSKTVKNPKLS